MTDHAVRLPDKLVMKGWVSDLMPADTQSFERPLASRGRIAWQHIQRLMNARELVTVATALNTYPHMLITKATAPVDRTTGRALRFTLELNEILFEALTVEPGVLTLVAADGGPAEDRTDGIDRGLLEAPVSTRQLGIRELSVLEQRPGQFGLGPLVLRRLPGQFGSSP